MLAVIFIYLFIHSNKNVFTNVYLEYKNKWAGMDGEGKVTRCSYNNDVYKIIII